MGGDRKVRKESAAPFWHQTATVTLIFAHEGCFEVVGHPLPHADGLWIAVIDRSRRFVEAIIPAGES